FLLEERRAVAVANLTLLVASLAIVHQMERGSLWSPYYRITVHQDQSDTVVEVNNIFHQSMAPVERKEYFYQWPYTVFGDRFVDAAIELLERPPRELHVHGGIVPRRARSPDAARRHGGVQLFPREMARRSPGKHADGGVR